MNLLLVGCGSYAKEAHLRAIGTFLEGPGRMVALYVADMEQPNIRPPGEQVNPWFIQLPDNPEESAARLSAEHERIRFDACIVATPPLHHKLYAKWALLKGIPVLVDKPLTFPDGAHVRATPARKIVTDFEELVSIAQNKKLLFLLGAQKRYQVVYRNLGAIIRTVHEKTRCPVTNVVCCTGDGWWLLPDEYDRKFHSYQSGGKLIHTGYHFLDIVPWLMRHASLDPPHPISHAWVIASVFRPADSYAAYGAEATKLIFGESKNLKDGGDLGDINANLMVRLCDKQNRQRASILFSLLHEGFSRRSSVGEEAVLGRTKTDYLALTQGPMLWAELRRIAKVGREGDKLGGPAHQELTVLCNDLLIPLGKQETVMDVKNQPLYAANSGAVSSCCENDEAPTIDFLKQVAMPGQESISPVEDHVIGVRLLAAAYESAAPGGSADGQPMPVRVDFGDKDWNRPPGIT